MNFVSKTVGRQGPIFPSGKAASRQKRDNLLLVSKKPQNNGFYTFCSFRSLWLVLNKTWVFFSLRKVWFLFMASNDLKKMFFGNFMEFLERHPPNPWVFAKSPGIRRVSRDWEGLPKISPWCTAGIRLEKEPYWGLEVGLGNLSRKPESGSESRYYFSE